MRRNFSNKSPAKNPSGSQNKNCDPEGFFCFHVIKEHQNSAKILCLCADNVFTILQVEHCNMRLMACKMPEIFKIKPHMSLWGQLRENDFTHRF